jgi:hypothetical protein
MVRAAVTYTRTEQTGEGWMMGYNIYQTLDCGHEAPALRRRDLTMPLPTKRRCRACEALGNG